ncbi:MAG: hypothetical protein AAGG59_11725, partial [Bacteroidota bacterium]
MYFQGQVNSHAKTPGLRSKIGVLVIFFLAASVFVPEASGQRSRSKENGTTIISKNKVRSSHRTRLGNSFDIEYKGDIEINDTDTDVTSISPGGYLEISK